MNPACDLEVDGGIDATTAPLAVEAGANVLVAGSSVFWQPRRRGGRHEAAADPVDQHASKLTSE